MRLGLLAFNQILHIVELGLKISLSIVNSLRAVFAIVIIYLVIFKKRFGLLTDHNVIG
jgi:hypothetical protein